MELITRKSECKHAVVEEMLIKSPKQITKHIPKDRTPKYCIIVKPFHASFLPYKQIVFRGVTFSDDFSIELIRNNEALIIESSNAPIPEHIFHSSGNATFRVMS